MLSMHIAHGRYRQQPIQLVDKSFASLEPLQIQKSLIGFLVKLSVRTTQTQSMHPKNSALRSPNQLAIDACQ